MKKTYPLLITLLFISCHWGACQTLSPRGYFGVKAGYQRVVTDRTLTVVGAGVYQSYGTTPRNTYYGGIFYQQRTNQWLLYRLELAYQQKGFEYRDQYDQISFQERLHYVGLTPLVGISPIANLSLLVGPEVNWLVKNSYHSPTDENTKSIELGLAARASYRYKWVGLEVGYSQAFTEYLTLTLPTSETKFKSRSWQVGLFVVPGAFKAGR